MQSKKPYTITMLLLAAAITATLTYIADVLGTRFADSAVEKAQRKNAEVARQINAALVEAESPAGYPPAIPSPDDLVRVDVRVCSKKWLQDSRQFNIEQNNLAAFEANLLAEREFRRCLDGYEEQGVESFPITHATNPPIEFPEESLMQDIAAELKNTDAYTCISAETQNDDSQGYEEPTPVSIPDYSDHAAPKGNLVSLDVKSKSRCPEGYTDHPGVFTDTVPEGYTTFNDGHPPKGLPPYRIIY
ncbi:MAG: hypothetical protein U1E36_08625 [Rickettsiales bacterium]